MKRYRIKTVSTLTGVPKHTLQAWEKRYAVVVPQRTESGYRLYSEADIEQITEIKKIVDSGLSVSEAIMVLKQKKSEVLPTTSQSFAAESDKILECLLVYDRTGASAILRDLNSASYLELLDEIYFPMLFKVGEGWHSGEYSVAQEHFVSAFCREELLKILIRLNFGPTNGPGVVCACFPNEHHEIGLMGVAIRLALLGWKVTWLGANVPLDSFQGLNHTPYPKLICISVIFPVPEEKFKNYIYSLREYIKPSAKIIIGGPGAPCEDIKVSGVEIYKSGTNMPFDSQPFFQIKYE